MCELCRRSFMRGAGALGAAALGAAGASGLFSSPLMAQAMMRSANGPARLPGGITTPCPLC